MTYSHIEKQRENPEEWVDIYGDALYSYALFRMEDKGVAEELVQETFVAALGVYRLLQGNLR